MKRREFLKYSSQLGLAGYLSGLLNNPLLAASQAQARFKNFIYCHFDLGWDVTLALDPQVKRLQVSDTALFLGYREDEIESALGIKYGPAARALKEFAPNTIAVNGVSMLGNVSHGDCKRWAETGILERRTAGLPAMAAVSTSEEKTAAVISNNSSVESGLLPVSTTFSSNLQNLDRSVEELNFLDENSTVAESYRTMMKYSLGFKTASEKNPSLKPLLQDTNDQTSALAAGAALSFLSGYSRSAFLEVRPAQFTLDTHSRHAVEHVPALANCFEQVIKLIKILQATPAGDSGRSLFDETLIVISSDFSREINLNGASLQTSGKEHNGFTNSYILLSGSLRGGITLGESTIQANALRRPAAHVARNFNFETGMPIIKRSDAPNIIDDAKAIKQIRPGHMVRTVASMMGFEDLLDPTIAALPKLRI